jgi:amino acid transporter
MFLFIPSVNTSYWMLTALTTQLTVLMYLLMLAAAIRLRYTEPDTVRPYRVPGGRYWGMWAMAGLGIIGSAFGLIIGFVPPSGIQHWPAPIYAAAMLGGIVICSLPPMLAHIFKKPNWLITNPDAILLDLDEVKATKVAATVAVDTTNHIAKKAS